MARYVFRSEWRMPAAPDDVYAVLADVETYPDWWPQVRRTRRIDEVSGEVVCRSLLPYDVTFVMHQEVQDPETRVLRARLDGDLTGTSRWTISADGGGSLAVFDEDVAVGKAMLRAAGRLLRPALRFNHDLMMRAGEKGLRAYLQRRGPGA
jgi:hypothetical protein